MAYDELDTLVKQRTFAKKATRELLCCKRKTVIKSFQDMIDKAKTQAEISRVMTAVRHTI